LTGSNLPTCHKHQHWVTETSHVLSEPYRHISMDIWGICVHLDGGICIGVWFLSTQVNRPEQLPNINK